MMENSNIQIINGYSRKDLLCKGSKNIFSQTAFDWLADYATKCNPALLEDFFLADNKVIGNCYKLYSFYKKRKFTKCDEEIGFKIICQKSSALDPAIIALIAICCVAVLTIAALLIRKYAQRHRRASHYKAFGSENTLMVDDRVYFKFQNETGSENSHTGLESFGTPQPDEHESNVVEELKNSELAENDAKNDESELAGKDAKMDGSQLKEIEDALQDESNLKHFEDAKEDESKINQIQLASKKEKGVKETIPVKENSKNEDSDVSSSRFLQDFTVLELLGEVS